MKTMEEKFWLAFDHLIKGNNQPLFEKMILETLDEWEIDGGVLDEYIRFLLKVLDRYLAANLEIISGPQLATSTLGLIGATLSRSPTPASLSPSLNNIPISNQN